MDKTSVKDLVIAAVCGALIMFCGVMAIRALFPAAEPPMDNKYVQERQKLETEHHQLQLDMAALADTNRALLDTIEELRQKPTQINHHHEQIRTANWHLDDAAAFDLLHARLAAEDTYRLRFVYHLNAN